MSPRLAKFTHIAINNRDGKWASIALANLAAEMSEPDLRAAQALVATAQLRAARERLARFAELDAPPFLIDAQRRTVARVEAGKSPALDILRRALKRIDDWQPTK